MVTVQDMVQAQNLLIEHFGIKKLHAVIGGSTGGMQALAWSALFSYKIKSVVLLATSYRHGAQNIAFHEAGRQAIMADPNWCGGKYLQEKKYPAKGLAVARMIAHITYLSEKSLQEKFGRNLQNRENDLNGRFRPEMSPLGTYPKSNAFSILNDGKNPRSGGYSFDPEFQVESYLHHQGASFVERFDANSYLYTTKAINYFDLETDSGGNLSAAFSEFAKNKDGKFCVISFSDDWLFPVAEAKKLTQALISRGINVSTITINSSAGHDSFLLENDDLKQTISGFLNQS
jgi:homoserine O-acetyltransferase